MQVIRPVPAPLDRPIRLAVLISGGGTTLVNFLRQIAAGNLPATVPIVIASRADCGGIARAREAGIDCVVIERRKHPDVADFSREIFERCRQANVDLVVLSGFLALIQVPDDFEHRVLNIHPALIPAFCGKGFYGHHVHEAVIARGVKVSGCTVHFADNVYDHGPIILQRCVPVQDDDTPDSLASRVFAAECEAYPEAIRLYAEGRIEIHDRRTRIREANDG